ncbi:MAG: hypothetical protein HFF32_06545 [Flavonifractor sp.]|nr:hypothetical protein [Flavonifractor sp.]
MRYRHLRFDIWLCLLISVGVSLGTAKIAKLVLDQAYPKYVESHTVAAGEIGGTAGPEVFRAQSIDDLLSHDTFTVLSPGIEYRNRGAGWYNGWYMYSLTLPSGELVAAVINTENVQVEGSYYTGTATLPVGRVMYEDLTSSESFIHQIEYLEPLTRRDFYVDMMGQGGKVSQEDYYETPTTLVQGITIVLCFPILHMLGSKIGIFPPFFVRRKKEQTSEWE